LRRALEQFERRVFAGEKVTDAQRRRAEDTLTKALDAEREPWGERARAAQQAVREAAQMIRTYVVENLDALLVELTENAERAAANVNERASDFLVAVDERRAAEQRTRGLCSLVMPMNPNSIPATRSDAARVEVARLLDTGGEPAPVLRLADPVSA
jgi:hypothetical protein